MMKQKIIERILALAALRGDITGRGSLLTDYDEDALGVIVTARGRMVARSLGLSLRTGADGSWILTDETGSPAGNLAELDVEDETVAAVAGILGVEGAGSASGGSFGGKLPQIRPWR